MTIKEMFDLVYKNELVLPDFQRNFVWNKSGQRALAASVILNLPVGSFLILQGKKDDFATKRIGYSTREATPNDECKFLLDGQQRITSLISIFGNMFLEDNWQDVCRDIYQNLKSKWYIRIVPKKGEDDIFGWRDLIFNSEKLKYIEPSQIEDMIVDKNILITKSTNWWNPGYNFINKDGEKLTRDSGKKFLLGISKEMAAEELIPLSVYDENDRSLLNYAIDHISRDRAMNLKIDLQNNLDKAQEILEKSDIDSVYDRVDEECLESILNELRERWKVNISNFFCSILDKTKTEIISLKSDEIGRAVIIFERINKGGTNLDNFDLVVARAARDSSQGSLTKRIIEYFKKDVELNDALTFNIKGIVPEIINLANMDIVKNNEINTVIRNQYLNLLSFLCYVDYGDIDQIKIDYTKKEKILNISYQDINRLTEKSLKGLSRCMAFLQVRCGIVKISDLNYKLMILPIAYMLLDDDIWNDKNSLDKIEYWYWGSIFSGEYRFYPNQVSINDIQNLYSWIKNGIRIKRYSEFEANVLNVKDFSDEDILVRNNDREIPTAVHKGILQYILSRQPYDLYYSNIMINAWDVALEREIVIDGEKSKCGIQDHHIIPLANATNLQESTKKIRDDKEHLLNSTLNRTYILTKTNNLFAANQPRKYLRKLEESNNMHMLNDHFIPDNYKEFFCMDLLENREKILQFYKCRYLKLKTVLLAELRELKHYD